MRYIITHQNRELISGIKIPQILYFYRFPQCSILLLNSEAVKTKQVVSIMADIDLNNADVRDMLNEIMFFCFMLEQPRQQS